MKKFIMTCVMLIVVAYSNETDNAMLSNNCFVDSVGSVHANIGFDNKYFSESCINISYANDIFIGFGSFEVNCGQIIIAKYIYKNYHTLYRNQCVTFKNK